MDATRIREARLRIKEAPAEPAARFVQAFDESRRGLEKISRAGISRVEAALVDLRREIRARLALMAGAPAEPFLVRILPQVEAEITAALADFTRMATAEARDRLAQAFELGSTVTANALGAAGVPLAAPAVTPQLLASLGAATESTFAALTSRIASRITREVRSAAAALQPASQAITRIEDILKSATIRDRVKRRIGYGFQSEAIVRTDVGRIYSSAQQAASEQIAETIPDLRKSWVTTLARRRGHREAEARYAPGGERGPIPVKQRFVVTEYSRSDPNVQGFWTSRRTGLVYRNPAWRARTGRPKTDRMLFPRDPAASAGNTVQCTCLSQDVLPELEKAAEKAAGVLQRGG